MTREEKIQFLKDVKAGKVKMRKYGFGLFMTNNIVDDVLTPDGRIVKPDEAKTIAEDYGDPLSVKIIYTEWNKHEFDYDRFYNRTIN